MAQNYNLFCLKTSSLHPDSIEISEQINNTGCLTRYDLFDDLFDRYFPAVDNYFLDVPHENFVSIDRGFFSPFNFSSRFRTYGFRLRYLKKSYSFLSDKIVVARLQVNFDGQHFIYIFFVKEVCNG